MKKLTIAIALVALTTGAFAQTPQSAADTQKENAAVAKEAKLNKADKPKAAIKKSSAPKAAEAATTPAGK